MPVKNITTILHESDKYTILLTRGNYRGIFFMSCNISKNVYLNVIALQVIIELIDSRKNV